MTKIPDHQRREAEVLIGNSTGPRRRNPITRLLTEPKFAVRAVRYAFGLPTRMETEDRRVLEEVVFPFYLGLPEIGSVLFVGCDWYTKHYAKVFFRGYDYWTIDISLKARKYGAPQHITDSVEFLDRHVPAERFDLIIFNGVFGFGLNTIEQCERALGNCYSRLRSKGHLLFGWTDVPARVPIPLQSIQALRRFQPFECSALGTWRYVTRTPYRHTYDFYRKAPAESAHLAVGR